MHRLRTLADYLESDAVPDDSFDIEGWSNECGTVCCAVGHACRIKEFADAGLRLVNRYPSGATHTWMEPAYLDFGGFEAVSEFFGIQDADAGELFDCEYDPDYPPPTRHDVARRIRAFVDEHEKKGVAT